MRREAALNMDLACRSWGCPPLKGLDACHSHLQQRLHRRAGRTGAGGECILAQRKIPSPRIPARRRRLARTAFALRGAIPACGRPGALGSAPAPSSEAS